MSNNVNVSIIVPTYNRAYIIERALQSILNQTYADFETIVVDDASTDNTCEIVQSIKDDRIRYIRHERNRGAAAARNTGITAGEGEYVAFLDSDDEWLPEKLEEQMAVFKNISSKVGVVYTGMLRIEGNNRTYIPPAYVRPTQGNIYYSIVLNPILVHTPTVLIRRDCLTKVGLFDENFQASEDTDLWIRVAKHYNFIFIDKPLVINYVMPDSLARKPGSYLIALQMILKKHYTDLRKDKNMLARFYINLGNSLCSQGRFLEGRGYFIQAAKENPSDRMYIFAYLATFLGQKGYDRTVIGFRKTREWWASKIRGHVLPLQ